MVQCTRYHHERNLTPIWDNPHFQLDQYCSDLFLAERLNTYPNLVASPSRAVAVVVAWPFATPRLLRRTMHTACPMLQTAEKAAKRAISKDIILRANARRTILYADGWPWWDLFWAIPAEVRQELLVIGQMVFVYHPPAGRYNRSVPAPVPALPALRNHNTCHAARSTASRGTTVYFAGSTRPNGDVRERLRDMPWRSIGAYFELTESRVEELVEPEVVEERVRRYAAQMHASQFCLILPGDDPTTRRLWDAVVSGCLPIFVTNGWVPYLPLNVTVPWPLPLWTIDERLPAQAIFDAVRDLVLGMDTATQARYREQMMSLEVQLSASWGFGCPLLDAGLCHGMRGGHAHAADSALAVALARVLAD